MYITQCPQGERYQQVTYSSPKSYTVDWREIFLFLFSRYSSGTEKKVCLVVSYHRQVFEPYLHYQSINFNKGRIKEQL